MSERQALAGLVVVDLSTSLASAYTSLLFADYGAEVITVEPPGGSALRSRAAWPFWSRGKKSVELDLHDTDDAAAARRLIAGADVVISSFRPSALGDFGLGYEQCSADNPGLVFTEISGFGPQGPYRDLKGYEAIVLAKLGALSGRSPTGRTGPVMPSALSTTFSAALLAIQGTLAALYERESSGRGQHVSASLVQGFLSHDSWSWLGRQVAAKWPGAFAEEHVVDADASVPSGVRLGLMVGLSADGRWLQFAHTQPKHFDDFLRVAGLGWTRTDPDLHDAENSDDITKRGRFWELLLEAVRSRTVAEWQEVFDTEKDVFAELFRRGPEVLDHPQMLYDEHTLVVQDQDLGEVREPNVLVKMSRSPGSGTGSPPAVGEHTSELLARAAARQSSRPDGEGGGETPVAAPLEGVTVIELATFLAGPFGTTLLADLGARVIKVEPIDGDPLRFLTLAPLPELYSARVMQGKESIALDLRTDEGREIVASLISRADMVMQSFRGGVARKLGLDDEAMHKLNPDLIYHYGQGYGVDGPYAKRPAYAPVIGAASGFIYRNTRTLPEGPDLTFEEIKHWAPRMSRISSGISVDHLAGLGVSAAMTLGLLARARGAGGQVTATSMLSTAVHVLSDDAITYDGRPGVPSVDSEYLGFCGLYRLYETTQGWVVLCVTTEREWSDLAAEALRSGIDLAGDARFTTATDRAANDADLIDVLSGMFRTRPAEVWEQEMTKADVACVAVAPGPPHLSMDEGALADQLGLVTTVEHPVFEAHTRTKALVTLSRSGATIGPGCLAGEHTDSILRELGYDDERIAALRAARIVG